MNSEFGSRVAKLRKEKKLTQKQFAEKINTTSTTVSAWETKGIMPTLDIAVRISKVFDVSLDWLCGTKSSEIKNKNLTYADVFRKIVELVTLTSGEINRGVSLDVEQWRQGGSIDLYGACHGSLLSDFEKVKALYDSGTLSISLYNTWLEGKYAELERYPYNEDGEAALAVLVSCQAAEASASRLDFNKHR